MIALLWLGVVAAVSPDDCAADTACREVARADGGRVRVIERVPTIGLPAEAEDVLYVHGADGWVAASIAWTADDVEMSTWRHARITRRRMSRRRFGAHRAMVLRVDVLEEEGERGRVRASELLRRHLLVVCSLDGSPVCTDAILLAQEWSATAPLADVDVALSTPRE